MAPFILNLGAQPVAGGVRFRVWAPTATAVEVEVLTEGRVISQITIIDSCQLQQDEQVFLLVFIRVTYTEWDPEVYQIPLTWLSSEQFQTLSEHHPLATITPLSLGDGLLPLPAIICKDRGRWRDCCRK